MSIEQNFKKIHTEINVACNATQRAEHTVRLLAVSKFQSIASMLELVELGQKEFGENYLQEALAKQKALANYQLTWHFIGDIQSNKTKLIAESFGWVQSLWRLKIAERLSQQRPQTLAPLNVCVQVNIDRDPHKKGLLLENVRQFCDAINRLPQLKLRGLMTILELHRSSQAIKESYLQLAQAYLELQKTFSSMDTLSMGMSDDFSLAIAAGSTMVRIGTKLFGPRNKS